jgi:hypothetical protein
VERRERERTVVMPCVSGCRVVDVNRESKTRGEREEGKREQRQRDRAGEQ